MPREPPVTSAARDDVSIDVGLGGHGLPQRLTLRFAQPFACFELRKALASALVHPVFEFVDRLKVEQIDNNLSLLDVRELWPRAGRLRRLTLAAFGESSRETHLEVPRVRDVLRAFWRLELLVVEGQLPGDLIIDWLDSEVVTSPLQHLVLRNDRMYDEAARNVSRVVLPELRTLEIDFLVSKGSTLSTAAWVNLLDPRTRPRLERVRLAHYYHSEDAEPLLTALEQLAAHPDAPARPMLSVTTAEHEVVALFAPRSAEAHPLS